MRVLSSTERIIFDEMMMMTSTIRRRRSSLTTRWSWCVTAVVLACSAGGAAGAQNFDRTSLRGLEGVAVIVERVIDAGGLYGLHRTGVRADAEYILEEAGIRVLSREEHLDVPAAPYLHINVDLVPIPETGRFAYGISVEVKQDVLSAIEPDTVLYDTTTWHHTPLVGSVDPDGLRTIRDLVEEMVEQFAEDFVAANQ